jgi:outer membrane biosynthesis protein TonB
MAGPRGVVAALLSFLVLVAAGTSTAASVTWPPSAGLVVAEVVTGGASASDEYVEIANSGSSVADLGGLELVYASASGTTVTRKVVFDSPIPLDPNRHFLLANASGTYAADADATYTGGFAADGGAVALRRTDGAVIDSVGWGTAANAFVETTPAPAPPARSSIERLPGGPGGNLRDTNDNAADFVIEPNPVAQSRTCAPVPPPAGSTASSGPTAWPTPEPTVAPSEQPTVAPSEQPTQTPELTATPQPTVAPSEQPTQAPEPTATPQPTPEPTTTPASTAETPEPTSEPSGSPSCEAVPATFPASTADPVEPVASATPAPVATPTAKATPTPTMKATPTPTATVKATPTPPAEISILAARAGDVGGRVHVRGIVTATAGLLGDDDLFAVADETAGILIRLGNLPDGIKAGREVEVAGTLADPYGQLEIREVTMFVSGGLEQEPEPIRIDLADVGESTEGALANVRGVVESVETASGHLTITIGDGSATVRLYAAPAAGLTRSDVTAGDTVAATGIVGQRASAKGRLDGYRVWLRSAADLVVRVPIATDPIATATPAPHAPTSTPAVTAGHDLWSVLRTKGAAADVQAVVTATAGLFEVDGPTIVVDDGTAAVAVVLPSGAAAPSIGAQVRVQGKIGTWETGPIVRATAIQALGLSTAPAPEQLGGSPDATVEWHLVRIYGRVDRVTHAGARWRLEVLVGGQHVIVLGEPASGSLPPEVEGRTATITGIVRRSTSDSSAFQVLPRGPEDVRLGAAISPAGSPHPGVATAAGSGLGTAAASEEGDPGRTPLADLGSHLGVRVTVDGIVSDLGPGEVTIDDGTAAARVGGEPASAQIELLELGDAIEVTGVVAEDDLGLLVVADPERVLVLPAELAIPTTVPATQDWSVVVPGASGTSDVGEAAARLASPGGRSLDPSVLVLVTLLVAAAAGSALAWARYVVLRKRFAPRAPAAPDALDAPEGPDSGGRGSRSEPA